VEIDGVLRPVCCSGCAAAAVWIRDAGLGDYYRLRSSEAPRVGATRDDYSGWLHPDVLAEHARSLDGGLTEITVLNGDMRCAACAWLIDRALSGIDGVHEVSANAVTGRIRVRWDAIRVGLPLILGQLAALGFAPYLATGAAREQTARKARRTDVMRLGVAGLGAMQAMMFAEALYLDFDAQMAPATRDFLRWIAFLVSSPVVFYSGWPFLAGMVREWQQRRLGMDALVGGSVLLAYFASLIETLRGGPHVWYDAAVMFVLLLLAARQLESWARARASAQVDTLARARPALAWREGEGGRVQVPLAALRPGDVVQVGAGEALPADGILLEAGASVDESLLTGEPEAVFRGAGEAVLAGSVCRESPLRLRVTATGTDTRLSHLVRLVEQAQGQRPRLARVADRIASVFVMAMFVLAALVFTVWLKHAPERAFEVTLALLVVSCPCALSLAIPAALAAAHGQLARLGVLSLRPDALETLARIDALLLDKTGTLTHGRPRLHSVSICPGFEHDRALALAAALQRDSGHPLGRAFAGVGDLAQLASAVAVVPGKGVRGMCDGVEYRLGRAGFAVDGEDDGAIWLGDGVRAFARFQLVDETRADAPAALAALRRLGIEPELSSGDGREAVQALAAQLQIARARWRQSPQDKLDRVRELQAEGHRVAMLGDGINDAPVLAGADVSFAMAGGAALAHRAADFVITGESLQRLPQSIDLARRTRRIIRQNLAWAIGYNLLALPLAALGLVAPWLAALGMALSSLLVTLNALRLARSPS
jgi:Cu2+-exporting ATPase